MRDILLTAVVFGLIPLALMRAQVSVYLWYWLGLMNPHRLVYGFAYQIPFAQIIGITALISVAISKDRRPVPWNTGLVLMLAILAYSALTSVFAWTPEAAWGYWIQVFKVFLMTFVMTMVIYGKERIHMLLLVVVFSIGFYGFKGGIFVFLTAGEHRVWGPPGNTFISDNNFLGLTMAMVVPLFIALARQEEKRWLRRLLYVVCFLTVIATVFTYSRGALLGLVVILVLTFIRSRKAKFFTLLFFIPLMYFAKDLVPEKLYKRTETIQSYKEDTSAMQRIRAWHVAWNIALDRPLTGAGFEFESSPANHDRWWSYVPESYIGLYGEKAHVAHSVYFQMLGQHGFIGLGLFLALLVSVLRALRAIQKDARANPDLNWMGDYASAIRIAIFGYAVSGSFLNVAFFDLLYLFVGITAVLHKELAASQATPATSAQTTSLDRRTRLQIQGESPRLAEKSVT